MTLSSSFKPVLLFFVIQLCVGGCVVRERADRGSRVCRWDACLSRPIPENREGLILHCERHYRHIQKVCRLARRINFYIIVRRSI
jgi:hypothetical protein